MSRIETVLARELRVGDVFSTDSLRVTSVTLLSGGGAAAGIAGVAVSGICHGIGKFAYLSPDQPCPLWREDGQESAASMEELAWDAERRIEEAPTQEIREYWQRMAHYYWAHA